MKKSSQKMILVVALAVMIFVATAAFADGIEVVAIAGTTHFEFNVSQVGDAFSTINLGFGGVSVSQISPVAGAPVDLGSSDKITFTTGGWTGGQFFVPGGSISYSNASCGGICFSGTNLITRLVGGGDEGELLLTSFTTNFVNPTFAALVGADFSGPDASGRLVLHFDPNDLTRTIYRAEYILETPEPASLLMLGSGLLAIGGSFRRKLIQL